MMTHSRQIAFRWPNRHDCTQTLCLWPRMCESSMGCDCYCLLACVSSSLFLRTHFPFLNWNLRANISFSLSINVCTLLCFVFWCRTPHSMTVNGIQFYEDELAMNSMHAVLAHCATHCNCTFAQSARNPVRILSKTNEMRMPNVKPNKGRTKLMHVIFCVNDRIARKGNEIWRTRIV